MPSPRLRIGYLVHLVLASRTIGYGIVPYSAAESPATRRNARTPAAPTSQSTDERQHQQRFGVLACAEGDTEHGNESHRRRIWRTATLSLKFALEHLGLGPCYHMSEVFAAARRNVPLWLQAVHGKPNWDALFDGFTSTTDYPACTYWRELADHYPGAKVILTVRDPDSWFDSVSETIFSEQMQGRSPVRRWGP